MSDKLKFILSSSADFFDVALSTSPDPRVQKFLESDDISILTATKIGEHLVEYDYKIDPEAECLVLYYKVPKKGNSKQFTVGILSVEGGLVNTIYNSISRVFSPKISLKHRSIYPPEVAVLIETLHAKISNNLGLPDTGILSISEEFHYWRQKIETSASKSDKETASMFVDSIEKIHDKIIEMNNQNSLNYLEESIDQLHSLLDDLWKSPSHYPQNRMLDMFNVLTMNVIEICTENLSSEDLWTDSSISINSAMVQVEDIINSWIQVCDSLTRLFWPNYSQHAWLGPPFTPKSGLEFKSRLEAIRNIKDLHSQILNMFDDADKQILTLNRMFSPFRRINVFEVTPMGTRKWLSVLEQFQAVMRPIDEKIAGLFKTKLQNHLGNPRQMMAIFTKFTMISKRPAVLELLKGERDQFLETLKILVGELHRSLSNTNPGFYPDTHISELCWECRWLITCNQQVQEILQVSSIFKIDQSEHVELFKSLESLKLEIKNALNHNFEKWCDNSVKGIQTGELNLKEDQPVVEFDKTEKQLMKVTFHSKLIIFCYDVHEFELQGFHVPIQLKRASSNATRFMSFARHLQQVSSFHNTIGDRIIPCQRPILLKNAVELANLVRSHSATWIDEDNVKEYTSSLQDAVNKLSKDNAVLAGYHEQMKKLVLKLMTVDLIRQAQVWKEEMRNSREIIATMERMGFTNLQAFKLHWDHQFYKVLEHQYVSGLLNLNFKLPDISVEIVFRQRSLQFRPPMEEIRAKYFYQLRRFIERPLNFRGLSDKSQSLFKAMVDRNRHYFGDLYVQAEELFLELEKQKEKWKTWIAMGLIDLDEFCKVNLLKSEDWDRNFRDCKQFSQQIAKLQQTREQVHCFLIDLTVLRTDIEYISRRYWEALTNSLRSSIINDITKLDEFIRHANQTLQNMTVDASDIAESGMKYEKIKSEIPGMVELLKVVQGKDTCLAGWCKERVTSLGNIQNQWEQLQPLIDNHHSVLQRQIDMMKDQNKSQFGNLTEEVEKFLIRWEDTVKELETNEDADLGTYQSRCLQWTNLSERISTIKTQFENYGMEVSKESLKLISEVEEKVTTMRKEWDLYEKFTFELDQVSSEEWMLYRRRPYSFNEFLLKWQKNLEPITLLTPSILRIRKSMEILNALVPTLQLLQSDALTKKHWAQIFQLTNEPLKDLDNLTLKDVLKGSFSKNSDQIQGIIKQANAELIVKQSLSELEQWGVVSVFKTVVGTDFKGNAITLIQNYQEVINKIGDNQCLLQSARNSAAFDVYSDQAEIWDNRLTSLDSILSSLSKIQRKWIYLEPVFNSGTIRNEETAYLKVDKNFRYIMKEIGKDQKVLSILRIGNISNIIQGLENQLTKCHTALNNFIQSKRNVFPRFYFLSDDDLLEFLGQSNKDNILQKHTRKLFPAVNSLRTTTQGDNKFISGIQSSEGDVVRLQSPVQISGPVEDWLNLLETEIKTSVKAISNICLREFNLTLEIFEKFPMQVLCLANAVHFTRDTEKAITSMNLPSLVKIFDTKITTLTNLSQNVKSNQIDLLKLKIRALLLDLVHQRDIIHLLIDQNITQLKDWNWLQQLRFYETSQQFKIRMVNAEFDYSFEYLGNFNKLVNTKLTHKCYLTLTQSMYLGLGCNPFGPAGTGKTECVKSLGAILGRLVLVFNCNENIDSESIGMILIGLARSGAWGCFDEFNRLQEQTLSTISMQIEPLQNALKNKAKSLVIMDQTINLKPECGLFVTLNPAGEDYGGRQKLPGNIQNLFRPVVMQEPEPKEISKVLLFVDGFEKVGEISNRLVELFTSCSKMLSPQRHYDWGLRELKTILTACGRSLHHIKSNNSDVQNPDELRIVLTVLQTNIMSKLTTEDVKIFKLLLSIMFPNMNNSQMDLESTSLRSHIESSFSNLGLVANQRQTEKCLELYEQLSKRMGVVVMGPPSSGKTTLIKVLKAALIASGTIIRAYTISPKSMPKDQFLGHLNPDTRVFHDGILTSTAIAVTSEDPTINSWIICDGDIDPDWIEALNSVLDDNKLLTLPSGWRIQFDTNVNFLFETHELKHASPATISRMGIINVNDADLDASLLLDQFYLKVQNVENLETIKISIEKCLWESLKWIDQSKSHPYGMSKINLTKFVLQALFERISTESTEDQIDNDSSSSLLSKEEFCCNILINNLACVLEPEMRKDFIRKVIFEWMNLDHLPVQSDDMNYIYYNSQKGSIDVYSNSHQWEVVDKIDNNDMDNILVKTPTMQVNSKVIDNFCRDNLPFLLIGPSGTGKTTLLGKVISDLTDHQLVTVNCSSQLTANYLLFILKENFLTTSGVRGREYKPNLRKCVLFLKNINLVQLDSYGSSDVIELLLQLIQRGGFYSDTLDWISVIGLQVCASMSVGPKDKFPELSPRFLALNRLLVIPSPSDEDLNRIVMAQFKSSVTKKNLQTYEPIIGSILSVFNQIKETFSPEKVFHYKFTPKMLTKVIRNMTYYSQDNFSEALIYEIKEVFQNRLTTQEDLETFNDILHRNLSTSSDETYFIPSPGSQTLQKIIFEDVTQLCRTHFDISNNEDILIDVPLDKILIGQITSICRSISRPNHHVVMVGTSGSGRRASVHIAASICSTKLFTVQPVKNYGKFDFYNDIKSAMQCAALENQNSVFLVDFTWINLVPEILVPIEAILENSVIPDLFGEDLENVALPLKIHAQTENYQESLANYFMKRVRDNMHLVILLEREEFNKCNKLFLKYPALYRNTEMLWLTTASSSQLDLMFVQMFDTVKGDNENISLPRTALEAIKLTKTWANSPLKLAQFVRCFVDIYKRSKAKIIGRCDVLQKGVEKLSDAHKVVETLRLEAVKQESELNEKRKMAAQALDLISDTMRNASDQKSDLLELKKKTQESSEKLQVRKKAIEEELKEVEPLLKQASSAVGQIKTEALSEIRSLRAPPEVIRDILEGVLRLMGIRDTSWNSMKSFLAKRGVKEDIRSLDPVRITPENCTAVQTLLRNKADSFETKNAKRASVAAAPLAEWVIANVEFAKVMQSIKPLEREQQVLQRTLAQAESEMKGLMAGLDDVDARVKDLSNQLNVYTQEAAVLEIKLEEVQTTLKSSEILVTKLGSEYQNWTNEYENLNSSLESMGNSIVITLLQMIYLSGLNLDDRQNIIRNIKHKIAELDHETELVTPQERIQWESMGLHPENQSMQNSGVVKEILKFKFKEAPIPLLLDPSGSAEDWLLNYLTKQKLSVEVSHQNEDRFAYKLELAIRFGKIMIVKDIVSLTPTLVSVIVSATFMRFNKKLLQVGNKLVDWHENFKLVLISRLGNVDFIDMDILARLSQIPYTTNATGFTDQLVSRSILLKLPDLEDRRKNLLENEGKLWEEREALQDKLLIELSTATGYILKNTALIESLNAVKQSSETIDKSLEESAKIRATLQKDFDQYRKISSKLSVLFMGLSKTYRLSPLSFVNCYLKVLGTEPDFNENRVFSKVLNQMYTNLARTVSKDRYPEMGLLFCKFAYPDMISDPKWESFITNFIGANDSLSDLPNWIQRSELKQKVSNLRSIHVNLYQSLNLENENLWKKFISPQESSFQCPVELKDFDKILITQIFRPDLLMTVVRQTTAKILGFNHLAMNQPTISQLAYESDKDKPILILSDPATDPSKELKEYVKNKNKLDKYVELSIGTGQELTAIQRIKTLISNGQWVCLKNVHLVPEFIKILELEFISSSSSFHQDFRLWILCESLEGFSDAFIMRSSCVYYELPNGLKLKVERHLRLWEPVLRTKTENPQGLKLSFIIFLFTGMIQERRSFIPQGFTKWYDFSDADLRAAMDLVHSFDSSKTPLKESEWDVIQGLMDILAFGGRIDRDQDLLVLKAHIINFFNNSVTSSNWALKNLMRGELKAVPLSKNVEDYYNYIRTNIMDNYSEPEYFGLARSTNVMKDVLFCRQLLKQLRYSHYETGNQENMEKRIRPIWNFWRGLTAKLTVWNTFASLETSSTDSSNPWQVFVVSEVRLAATLFNTIKSTLIEVQDTTHQNPSDLLGTLSDNQVPADWRKLWYGPKNATSYLKAAVVRGLEAEKRYQSQTTSFKSAVMDLSTVFNVDSLLAAAKLMTALEMRVSPHQLTIKLKLDSDSEKNRNLLAISPIYIEGGFQLDQVRGKLVQDSGGSGSSETTKTTPQLALHFEMNENPNKDPTKDLHNEILIPLYSNSSRDFLICHFKIPVNNEVKDAVLFSGAAFIIPEMPL